MKPVLYPSTTQTIDDPCIGHLADAISCKVTEDIDGVFDIEIQYPSNGPFASDIVVDNMICVLYPYRTLNSLNTTSPEWRDITIREELFDISKVEITDDVMTIFGHQRSYRLNYCIVNGTNATQSPATVSQAITNLETKSTPQFHTVSDFLGFTPHISKYITATRHWESVNIKSVRSYLTDTWYSLQKIYGVSVSFHNKDINIASRRGKDDGVEIRIGKNIVKRQWSQDEDGTFNALAPYWVKDDVKVVTNPLIVTPTTARTPQKAAIMDFTDDFITQPSAAELETYARAFLDDNKPWQPSETTHIEIAPLWDTNGGTYANRIVLGDDVTVFWKRPNAVKSKLQVVRTVYDCLSEEYETIELGNLQRGYVVTAFV